VEMWNKLIRIEKRKMWNKLWEVLKKLVEKVGFTQLNKML
jgi:hypothetical protein